ncbi:septum formation initiator [Novosphingobium sp. G106]|uniref:FtsB family cell division protein n=1 Tax=Novosphingobium sp. G106 TaxID=2849500 RepID=UPI001C2D843D|nr:septum formation initiator [Novosphingobium sp. G106]MBV1687138.1 septum formation initiator [Novosphingobium sp. G106]
MIKKTRTEPKLARESLVQGFALMSLLVLAGVSLVGPSGLLAWSENQRLLVERRAQVVQLTKERDELRNRVALLDPRHMDPDLAGELLRSNLNVAHPDEMVMLLH